MGAMGTVQNERKLAYYEVVLSGHMVPQFSPQVRLLESLPSARGRLSVLRSDRPRFRACSGFSEFGKTLES